MSSERVIWEGKPSHIVNLGSWFWGVATLWIAPVMRTIRVFTTNYRVTDQRVVKRYGILSKRTDNMEFYRVSDVIVEEPLLLRLFGKVTVVLKTADATHPEVMLLAVPNIPALTEGMRQIIEGERDRKGVRMEERF